MNVDYSLGEVQKVARLATKAINSDIILLSGEVGVGKTTLIKEILRTLKVNDNVNSPTFSIINEYITRDKKIIYHIDLYRIKTIDELHSIGFFEYLDSKNLCFIEWGDIIEEILKVDYNKFLIVKNQNFRSIKMIK
ncbi:MAG TPA: tRNA (adenosine(37)-N6)-threonylcarbamoyltransferase complex ATPase subunit type 1 TsaE [Flavobacteriaceae bacterium]|jgi:tRNA threonylcarbamoyladenosine biosynthesis protein TsaE|nr:tRNA (adenosine(37)-N6)-threonylcarbamoyltransferase complex ATPase subunit type 1 TsaE [Flavobacteriaceae bacterium]MDP7183504.1 tRNA (adenosine(37)-N6)-threonylcarbamoyltransferase complex ATPase subunit type 1 TsaE [Flavobacteriaceae bacterium]HJO70317.1 tRNA (adenosine(37)-N6)-threonylcarbamoyltransferase complex ATPase subunit type 1 TsaE [Flavobacteriaceae bacterium]|tara:strand:+ start:5615 stop:6022 length:408 start_codon:yes stop_codon:yes gene_type:complete